jgi:hypothetical protein
MPLFFVKISSSIVCMVACMRLHCDCTYLCQVNMLYVKMPPSLVPQKSSCMHTCMNTNIFVSMHIFLSCAHACHNNFPVSMCESIHARDHGCRQRIFWFIYQCQCSGWLLTHKMSYSVCMSPGICPYMAYLARRMLLWLLPQNIVSVCGRIWCGSCSKLECHYECILHTHEHACVCMYTCIHACPYRHIECHHLYKIVMYVCIHIHTYMHTYIHADTVPRLCNASTICRPLHKEHRKHIPTSASYEPTQYICMCSYVCQQLTYVECIFVHT